MRWDGQLIDAEPAEPGLFPHESRVRTVQTPEFAGMTFYEVRARSVLNRVPERSQVPFRWTVNPYRGCAHACVYCFARSTHSYLELDTGHDFDTKVVVKVNAGDRLRRELMAVTWRGEHIAMGTNVDCYQRAEGRYRLMRGVLEALRDAANPFSILTKGTLILRDVDLIASAAERADVSIAGSVGSVDLDLWRSVEPGTPAPGRRLAMLRAFADAGVSTSVLMAPILPGLSDGPDRIDGTVAALAAAGVRRVTPLVLHLRPGAREWYAAWLAREHPQLRGLYRRLYGRGSYAPANYTQHVRDLVDAACHRHGITGDIDSDTARPARGRWVRRSASRAPAADEQLSLIPARP
ncbi:MAG: Rv2578c family radical SAM protein [Mycobacteriales bacterium]